MSKRFTDTDKWEREWFMDLPDAYRLAYLYILDKCDQVGVWNPNERLLKFFVGDISLEKLREYLDKRLYIMPNKKWWLTKFIDFQYGTLNEESLSKPIISYINLLKKHNLYEGYTKGIYNLKDKDKDTDKEKDKEKDKAKEKDKEVKVKKIKPNGYDNISFTDKEIESLSVKYNPHQIKKIFDKLSAYKLANGKNYKSDYGAIISWVADSVKTSGKFGKSTLEDTVKSVMEDRGIDFNTLGVFND